MVTSPSARHCCLPCTSLNTHLWNVYSLLTSDSSTTSKISMTKLVEWLTAAVLFFGPWTAVVTNTVQNEFTLRYYYEILLLPVLLVALFGVVSIAIIAYRVYTFNDCKEASEELQQQIKEAKADLAKKGLKLD